jgi:hypothetical protein
MALTAFATSGGDRVVAIVGTIAMLALGVIAVREGWFRS